MSGSQAGLLQRRQTAKAGGVRLTWTRGDIYMYAYIYIYV